MKTFCNNWFQSRQSLILLMALSFPLVGNALSGEEFLKLAQSPSVRDNYTSFIYLDGTLDAISFQDILFDQINAPKWRVCRPDDVTNAQVMDMVKKSMAESPEEGYKTAYYLIYKALIKEWACEK